MLCYVLRHSLVVRLKRLIKTFSNTAAPVTQSDMYHTEILSSMTISHGLVAVNCDALCVWPTSLMPVLHTSGCKLCRSTVATAILHASRV